MRGRGRQGAGGGAAAHRGPDERSARARDGGAGREARRGVEADGLRDQLAVYDDGAGPAGLPAGAAADQPRSGRLPDLQLRPAVCGGINKIKKDAGTFPCPFSVGIKYFVKIPQNQDGAVRYIACCRPHPQCYLVNCANKSFPSMRSDVRATSNITFIMSSCFQLAPFPCVYMDADCSMIFRP